MKNTRQLIMISISVIWLIATGAVFSYMVYTTSELYISGMIISYETVFLCAGTVFFILLLFTGKKAASSVRHLIAGIILAIWLILAISNFSGSLKMDIENNSHSYTMSLTPYKEKEIVLSERDRIFDFSEVRIYKKKYVFIHELGSFSDTYFNEHKLIRNGKYSCSYDDFYQEIVLTLDYGGWNEDTLPEPAEKPEKLEKRYKLK